MNSNFKAEWVPLEELLRRVEAERSAPSGSRYYFSGRESSTALIETLEQRGFSSFESFTSDPGNTRFEILRWKE